MKLSKPRIMVILAERGMTVKDLAGLMGIQPSNLSALLNRSGCMAPTAGKVARALNVPVSEIVEG